MNVEPPGAEGDGAAALLVSLCPTIEPPPPEVDPRVVRVTARSEALGVRKAFYVYLPPGYRRQARPYPSLYLLRGHEREWVNPAEDRSRRGTVIDVYLRLLASGRVGPMILVFPGLTSDDGRVHSMATDMKARVLAPETPGLGTGRFETYLVRELIPLVDLLFHTAPDGRCRGVDGFSLGGFMALKLATRYPDMVATAGAYDGTFLYASRDGRRIRRDDRVFTARICDPVFGVPRDQTYAAAGNPANLIVRGPSVRLRHIRWLLQSGPEQLEPWGSNYYRGAYLRALLAARGLRNEIPAVIHDGTHSWSTADRHMETSLPVHWEALRDSSGQGLSSPAFPTRSA